MPTNCLSVFDHFVKLACKGSNRPQSGTFEAKKLMENRIIKKTPSIKQKEKGVETDLKQTQVMQYVESEF